MLSKETKGGNKNASVPVADAGVMETRWLVGKSLLNGGKKLRPDLQELLDKLGVTVSKVVIDHGPEPMV
ncbi:MAG: hypothetical protein NTX82_01560, partial [Candidatus Parcubacteria bacterium]|nr:hypothetical protein [Candidatus Parcubacteria bacterium]